MKLIDLYREEQHLSMNRDGDIWILPNNQYSFTTFPLPDDFNGCIKINEDEYFGLLLHRFMFDESLSKVVDFVQPVEENIEVENEEN